MTGRDEFGPALRRERERRGITLEQIADRTKISASLFAAMERNDFSRWPNGIFRRSFLRAYAEVVGLDADALVQQVLRLFPGSDPDHVAPPSPVHHQVSAAASHATSGHGDRQHRDARSAVRLGGAAESVTRGQRHATERLAATLADLGLVALLAGVGWLLGGWFGVGPAAALGGLLIFVVGNVLLGKTPGAWLMGNTSAPARAAAASQPAAPARAVADDRMPVKRRSIADPHQTARRHTVRRLDRSRSRRA